MEEFCLSGLVLNGIGGKGIGQRTGWKAVGSLWKEENVIVVVLTTERIDIPQYEGLFGRLSTHLRFGIMNLVKPIITVFFLILRFSV